MRFGGLALQLEPGRGRPLYARVRVRVRRYMDGSLSVWHGPRLLRRYGPDGTPRPEPLAEAAWDGGGIRLGKPDSLFVLKPDICICLQHHAANLKRTAREVCIMAFRGGARPLAYPLGKPLEHHDVRANIEGARLIH